MRSATPMCSSSSLGGLKRPEHWTFFIFLIIMKSRCGASTFTVHVYVDWRSSFIKKFRTAILNSEGGSSELKKFCSRPTSSNESLESESGTLMDLFTAEKDYNRPLRSRICSSIVQYLLLDTVSWQCGGPSNRDSSSISKRPLPPMNHTVSRQHVSIHETHCNSLSSHIPRWNVGQTWFFRQKRRSMLNRPTRAHWTTLSHRLLSSDTFVISLPTIMPCILWRFYPTSRLHQCT